MKTIFYLLSLSLLISCYSSIPISKNSSEIQLDREKKYILVLKDQSKITVQNLRIADENYFFVHDNIEKSMPISEVTELSEKKFSWGKTILFSAGVTAATLGIYSIMTANMLSSPNF